MSKITITDSEELFAPAIQHLEAVGADFEVLEEGLAGIEAAERARESAVVMVGVLPFPRAAIDRLEGAGLIIRCGIGVDIVDIKAASARSIRVANVPDYCVDEVADHTLTLLLAIARRVPDFAGRWRGGQWAVENFPPVGRLRGSTIGVIGLGRIGRQVVNRAQAFGMQPVAFDPGISESQTEALGAEPVAFAELLERSHMVTLHCPLTESNHHLIDSAALAQMRSGAILVNTSRGGLVNLDALDSAIGDGKLAGAGLDVLDGEPSPPLDHPLLRRPEVLVTPHVAWYSQEARRDLSLKAAASALQFLAGQIPATVVNEREIGQEETAR